jgi:hypothetical protein
MKKFFIIYECSNGYECRCCNHTWNEYEIYELNNSINEKEYIRELKSSTDENYKKTGEGRRSIIFAAILKTDPVINNL